MDMVAAMNDARARVKGLNPDGTPRRECSLSVHAPAAQAARIAYDARDPLDWPDTQEKRVPKQPSVLQEWVQGLPLMQQTVLLTAIRGPDGAVKFHPTKPLWRWYRRCVLISAFEKCAILNPVAPGGGSFTGPVVAKDDGRQWQEQITFAADAYLEARDELPHHIQMHAMHSFEIVGYKHSEPWIREWWRVLYERIVHAMHLWPESEFEMDKRLGDKVEDWHARADVSETRGVCVTCSD